MSFADIKDQPIPLRFLRNLLRDGRIPNALLFWGPPGVGKHFAARETAMALFCPEGQIEGCGQCLTCRKLAKGNHPDFTVVAPLKKSRIIDVKAIEGIIEFASLRPFEAKWRVFLIHEAHRMGVPAQNHLLKTLEEPLGKSVFILLSEHPTLLLPTIRSRCQRLRFGCLRPETVAGILMTGHGVGPETAQSIAALSQGQMARAIDLVESDRRQAVLETLGRLQEGEDPLALAEEFAKHLANHKAQIEATVKAEADPLGRNELSKEDRERIEEEQTALVDAMSRRDIMEHLYLIETWCRDELVYGATQDQTRIFNRDQWARLEKAERVHATGKIAAIGKARMYLERFLNEERVFRDLFFALAPARPGVE